MISFRTRRFCDCRINSTKFTIWIKHLIQVRSLDIKSSPNNTRPERQSTHFPRIVSLASINQEAMYIEWSAAWSNTIGPPQPTRNHISKDRRYSVLYFSREWVIFSMNLTTGFARRPLVGLDCICLTTHVLQDKLAVLDTFGWSED